MAAPISMLCLLLFFGMVTKADKGATCNLPLGMEKGHIKDEDITASSAFDFKSVGPHLARLDQDLQGGAWCPKKVIEPGVREWIEIDLKRQYRITQTATQGRYGGGQGQEYAEQFILEYWRPSLGEWKTYKNHSGHSILPGNSNTYLANWNILQPPIVASKVRFVPYSPHKRTVCMRVEVMGCLYEEAVVSYNAPAGDEFAPNFYLEDVYDGDQKEDPELGGQTQLFNGRGVLADGLYGGDVSLKAADSLSYSAQGWVGWNNKNRPLTLTFEFGQRQEFTSVTLTTFWQADLSVQPFSQMLAYFSADGLHYHSQYVKVVNKQQPPQPRQNITLSLASRVGRFVRLELYFDGKWLLLSEVTFHSQSTTKAVMPQPPLEGARPASEQAASSSDTLSDPPADHIGSDRNSEQAEDHSSNGGNSSKSSSKGPMAPDQNHQVYIGLVIGILGVTVVLLLVTIIIMMRRNKQKIFNKHSMMFKSQMSSGLDRHMMRDLTPLNHSNSLKYPHDDTEDLEAAATENSNSIYHEPYRLVLQSNRGCQRNNSCGRLCDRDYEDLCSSSSGLLLEQKNKFGSTPLFNIPPAPPPLNSASTVHRPKFAGPVTSISCHEVKNGYAIPLAASGANPESFYAATDIVNQSDKTGSTSGTGTIRTYPELDGSQNSELFTTLHLPLHMAAVAAGDLCTSLPNVPEFPRHQLRLLEKLGEGAFGMVHLCEANEASLDRAGSSNGPRKAAVVVKSLWKGTTQSKRNAFVSTVQRLSLLRDPNVAQILAACTQDEPLCVLSEFSDFGDLYHFLRSHQQSHYSNDLNTSLSSGSSGSPQGRLSTSTLLYMSSQIASGMKYLESQGFVHRDLAARNCLVGASYHIKISDCAMFRPAFKKDYFQSDRDVLPLRWIPWEVHVMRLWSSKSDVWSFGVTMWEIFTYCQEQPLADLNEDQVCDNLKHWFHSDGFGLTPRRPTLHQCTKEMFDLIRQCWSREPEERPLFMEIHQFLQNKCLGFSVD